MKALAVTAKERLELVNIPKPVPREGQVLIKVAYCGLCGSDMPRYFQGAVHQFPQILGHEFSGTIASVGQGVSIVREGDRVVAAPLVPCGLCYCCRAGRTAMCEKYSFIGSRENGALAEFVAVNEENVLRIPDKLSLKNAALLEPLAVALHGVERLPFKAGATVLIYGAGTIGLLTAVSARARGAGKIIAVDIDDHKLSIARTLGVDVTINSRRMSVSEYIVQEELPQIIFETAGQAATQREAVTVAGVKGSIVFIGTCTQEVSFTPDIFEHILRKELIITGSWMGYSAPFPGYEWQAGLNYLASGAIDAAALISHVYRLDDGSKPFNDMKNSEKETVKVMYHIDGSSSC